MSGDYTGYFCAGNFNGATISKFAQKVRDEETQHVARALIANTDETTIHLLNREAQLVLRDAEQHPPDGRSDAIRLKDCWTMSRTLPATVWIGDAPS